MDSENAQSAEDACCGQLFFAHWIGKHPPLVVLECCLCGRLWHRREDGRLIPYDKALLAPAFNATPCNDTPPLPETETPSH
jgi:hypothetical protein